MTNKPNLKAHVHPRIPWRERPNLSLRDTADLLACSPTMVTKLIEAGALVLVRIPPNLKAVKTEGVIKLVDAAEPIMPSRRERVHTQRIEAAEREWAAAE